MAAVAALSVVVVVAACRRHRACVYSACGHVAIGFYAHNGFGVDGEVVVAGATGAMSAAAIVVVA